MVSVIIHNYVAMSAMKPARFKVNMTLLIIFQTAMRKDQPYQKVCKEFFCRGFCLLLRVLDHLVLISHFLFKGEISYCATI